MRPELSARHLNHAAIHRAHSKGPRAEQSPPGGRAYNTWKLQPPLRQAGTGLKGKDAGRDNDDVNKLARGPNSNLNCRLFFLIKR